MLIKKLYFFAATLLFSVFLSISAMAELDIGGAYFGNIAPPPAQFVPDQVVVKFMESVTDDEAGRIMQKMRAKMKRRGFRRAFSLFKVPRGRVWQTVNALSRDPRVLYAHPDWIVHATFVPNDPGYPLQWHLNNDDPNSGSIHMEDAWDLNPGGSNTVTVAVLDSGIAYENYASFCQAPDLMATNFVPGYDFINDDEHANDDFSHGTHVAGTIAQSTHNGQGVAGIAYNVSLMPVKVLNSNGTGSISQIADGIRFAVDNGADVINMSFGTSAPRFWLRALENAVSYAHDNGVLMVASSGNDGANNPLYPARYSQVISVGATLYDKSLAPYSNRGNELCGPGGTDQKLDVDGDGDLDWLMVLQNTFDPNTRDVCDFSYWYFSGTSMAAPHVSGVSALLLSENPLLTHEEIRQILKDTADKNTDSACGSGLINASAALQAVTPTDTPPEVSIDFPSDGETVFDTVTVQIDASDFNDAPGTLTVKWSLNGGTWETADYNLATGFYEATWDTIPEIDGPHTLQARATDSADQTTESAIITVTVNNINEAPVALFTYDCNGSICDFDASGSYDTDGSIVSYEWDFGDSSTGSGKTTSHTFTETGIFPVVLTVTDNIGAKGSSSQDIEISQVTNTLHVADLDATSFNVFWGIWGTTVTITVKDAGNSPVANATVSGVFSDGPDLFICTTSGSGTCQITGYQWTLNCLTYTVVDVAHGTLNYRAEENSDLNGDSNGTEITSCRP